MLDVENGGFSYFHETARSHFHGTCWKWQKTRRAAIFKCPRLFPWTSETGSPPGHVECPQEASVKSYSVVRGDYTPAITLSAGSAGLLAEITKRAANPRTRATIVEKGIIDLPHGEGRHAPSRMVAGRSADQRAPS